MSSIGEWSLMWAWVLYDLPTETKQQRRLAHKFRQYLLDEGFQMAQFSVYLKLSGDRDQLERLFDRVARNIPSEGSVHCIGITDKQFGKIRTYVGKKSEKIETPSQLRFL